MLIIPTYNERENIASLVSRIRSAVGDEPILFADDNSPDGTGEEILRIQKQDNHVHLMARPGKGGYGSACRDAMKKVLKEDLAEYVIQSDADLSHPPEALPRMLELLKTHPVVIGSRYVTGGGAKNWSLRRRTLSFGANLYARLFTGVPVHDMTAGFVGYRTDVLRKMKFNLHRSGASFCEFAIIFCERECGKSKFDRKILLEGVRFPLKAFRKRIAGVS